MFNLIKQIFPNSFWNKETLIGYALGVQNFLWLKNKKKKKNKCENKICFALEKLFV